MNSFFDKFHRQFTTLLILLIVGGALLIRFDTFRLPHFKGDQHHYLALALKLDKLGFANYNLKGIDLDMNEKKNIAAIKLNRNPNSDGVIITTLNLFGLRYYDKPFFHKPPLFSYMIALSHRIFHSSEETYCAVCSVLNEVGAKKSLSDYLKIQFYAAIIPFIFSLLGILAVFYLGKTAFDETAGMYAAFFFAINPVDIFVSHKLLTDGILSFFVTISLVCYLMSIKKQKNKYLLFLSGVLCGFSILAKQSAGVTVVAIILYMLIKDRNWLMLVWGGALSYPFLQTLLKGKEELYIFILIAITIFSLFEIRSGTVVSLSQLMINRQALIFLTGVFLVSGFWFIRMYQVYGEFLYSPSASAIRPAAVTDITGWFLHIRSRPLGMISYLTATIYLSPLFAISLVSLKKYFIDLFFMIKHKNADSFFVLSWFIILSYLYMFKGTSELRYIMPAYPFLAVLSGYYFSQIVRKKIFLERSRRKGTLCFVIALFLLLSSSFWSVIIAKETVKSGRMFFDIPF